MKYMKNAIWKLQMYHHYTAKKSNFHCLASIQPQEEREKSLVPCVWELWTTVYLYSHAVGIKSGQYR